MSPWWLCLIVPVSMLLGFMIFATCLMTAYTNEEFELMNNAKRNRMGRGGFIFRSPPKAHKLRKPTKADLLLMDKVAQHVKETMGYERRADS